MFSLLEGLLLSSMVEVNCSLRIICPVDMGMAMGQGTLSIPIPETPFHPRIYIHYPTGIGYGYQTQTQLGIA